MTSPKKSKILNFKHAQNRKFNEENTVEFTTDDEEMTFEFELEEDCDATIFFDRYKELYGEIQIRVTSNIADNMSSIRYYDTFGKYSDEYNIPPCGGSGIPTPV